MSERQTDFDLRLELAARNAGRTAARMMNAQILGDAERLEFWRLEHRVWLARTLRFVVATGDRGPLTIMAISYGSNLMDGYEPLFIPVGQENI